MVKVTSISDKVTEYQDFEMNRLSGYVWKLHLKAVHEKRTSEAEMLDKIHNIICAAGNGSIDR